MRKGRPESWLKDLAASKAAFGDGAASRKLWLLRALARHPLKTAPGVLLLHEILCFLRAYPDDPSVLAQVRRMLAAFPRRADLARHRARLADTGIAGTDVRFAFFPSTAGWLARRCGESLSIVWDGFEPGPVMEGLLAQFGLAAETPAFDAYDYGVRGWIRRMKGPAETDAAFFLKRLEQLGGSAEGKEAILEHLDIPFRLTPGAQTPSRTFESFGRTPVAFQSRALDRSRPRLALDVATPPESMEILSPAAGRRLIDTARGCMVTRARDLDAFCYGDPGDVRLFGFGDGLHIGLIGVAPERRFLLEALYGFLILKNRVPVGYGTYTSLFGSAEVAFTVFDAFRAGEAARMYGKVLAVAKSTLGCTSFTIHPYQIGQDNEDAVRSGAWWFYQKLGFRPPSRKLLDVMAREERRMARSPGYRSSAPTLRRLASECLCFHLGDPREDVVGLLPLAGAGLAVTAEISRRFGFDRRRAERVCLREAVQRVGVEPRPGFTGRERLAWRRWAPLLLVLPGLETWSRGEREALVRVIRAKGGRRESDYVITFDAHGPLRRSLVTLVQAQ